MAIDAKERAEMNDLKRERRALIPELERLKAKVDELEAECSRLEQKVEKLQEGKRGPGRPRKVGNDADGSPSTSHSD